MRVRDAAASILPDLAVVGAGFLIARWWGLLFAVVCAVVARRGPRALAITALVVLVAMVIAMFVQGPLHQGFGFVTERPIANELGLLLIVAVLALAVPRRSDRELGSPS